MKNYYVFFFFVAFGFSGYAQVGIGTTTPNESSQLEVVATNKGILIPRVLLKSTKDTTTISSGNVESLLVFNTQTIADVIPGYYYWYIDKWNRLGATNSETITTIEDKGNGVYVYTNEIGVKYTINVAQGPQGKDGKDGASIRGGDGAPGKDTGSDGDTYIDNSTGDVYYKEGDVWNIKGNIKGPKGDSGTNGKDGLQGGIGLIENGLNTTVNGSGTVGSPYKINTPTSTLINNNDGSYNYNNEEGVNTKIDVVGDVVTNIKNEGPVYNEIVNLLNSKSDKFADNGNGTFIHTTVDGKEVIFDANTTTVTNNGDGTYTVTNKKGETVKIDVVGDVVTNIKNEGPVYNEIVNLLNSKSDKFADNGNGTFTHTTVDGKEVIFDANTTTVTNNGDGTYTVTNKKGETVKIDVVGDVVTNIKNEGPVYNEIVNLLNSKSDKFADNGNGTFTHTTVDGKEVIFDANTTTVTNNGDGTYTVANKKGETVKIDVVGDVVTNIKNEGPVYNEIVNLLNSKSDKFADNGNGTFTHTTVDGKEVIFDANTTTVTNNGDGTYTV
ncbi:hypothetical protein GON26_10080, partial [Flavobacterium sp. GA093]|nr:hypothetical protein [Flavobacterium hydrocarbonoxydans]